MSFFIDETNFLASIGLDNLFKVKPDYQVRDEIETKISAILPYKHTVSVEESDIKVEVFHSDVTDKQLAKIETVINDTFKVCQKYKIVPDDTNVSFRMFLFEDREQYVNIRNISYHSNVSSDSVGVTILTQGTDVLADVLVYRESDDEFSFESDSFDKIDYYTLSHEFVHCMQNIVRQNSNEIMSKPILEGSANSIACEALHGEKGVPASCYIMETYGIKTIKSESIKLNDIYFDSVTTLSNTVKNPYSTGMAMFKFFSERHPELIEQLSEYSLDGNASKFQALMKKVNCINDSGEFTNWIKDFPLFDPSTSSISTIKVENPNVTNTLKFLSERHPEMIDQLSEWLLNNNMEKVADFAKKAIAINCSGEFKNWNDEHLSLPDQSLSDSNII